MKTADIPQTFPPCPPQLSEYKIDFTDMTARKILSVYLPDFRGEIHYTKIQNKNEPPDMTARYENVI